MSRVTPVTAAVMVVVCLLIAALAVRGHVQIGHPAPAVTVTTYTAAPPPVAAVQVSVSVSQPCGGGGISLSASHVNPVDVAQVRAVLEQLARRVARLAGCRAVTR